MKMNAFQSAWLNAAWRAVFWSSKHVAQRLWRCRNPPTESSRSVRHGAALCLSYLASVFNLLTLNLPPSVFPFLFPAVFCRSSRFLPPLVSPLLIVTVLLLSPHSLSSERWSATDTSHWSVSCMLTPEVKAVSVEAEEGQKIHSAFKDILCYINKSWDELKHWSIGNVMYNRWVLKKRQTKDVCSQEVLESTFVQYDKNR